MSVLNLPPINFLGFLISFRWVQVQSMALHLASTDGINLYFCFFTLLPGIQQHAQELERPVSWPYLLSLRQWRLLPSILEVKERQGYLVAHETPQRVMNIDAHIERICAHHQFQSLHTVQEREKLEAKG
jgi:hypothetical protein